MEFSYSQTENFEMEKTSVDQQGDRLLRWGELPELYMHMDTYHNLLLKCVQFFECSTCKISYVSKHVERQYEQLKKPTKTAFTQYMNRCKLRI